MKDRLKENIMWQYLMKNRNNLEAVKRIIDRHLSEIGELQRVDQ